MRTKESYLIEISKHRRQHTRNANLGKWMQNDIIRSKIKGCWAAYHKLVEQEATTQSSKFNFWVVDTATNTWATRHNKMRSAVLSQRKLSKFGSYIVQPIPLGHEARNPKAEQQIIPNII